jgi:hypothetical protein
VRHIKVMQIFFQLTLLKVALSLIVRNLLIVTCVYSRFFKEEEDDYVTEPSEAKDNGSNGICTNLETALLRPSALV